MNCKINVLSPALKRQALAQARTMTLLWILAQILALFYRTRPIERKLTFPYFTASMHNAATDNDLRFFALYFLFLHFKMGPRARTSLTQSYRRYPSVLVLELGGCFDDGHWKGVGIIFPPESLLHNIFWKTIQDKI